MADFKTDPFYLDIMMLMACFQGGKTPAEAFQSTYAQCTGIHPTLEDTWETERQGLDYTIDLDNPLHCVIGFYSPVRGYSLFTVELPVSEE